MALVINNKIKKSTDSRNSRYVQGGTADIYSNRIGWWERRILERQDDDIRIIIKSTEGQRPDLISHRVYGKATYSWLVLQYNNIVDPVTEMIPGKELFLPTQVRLALDIITKPPGGNTV